MFRKKQYDMYIVCLSHVAHAYMHHACLDRHYSRTAAPPYRTIMSTTACVNTVNVYVQLHACAMLRCMYYSLLAMLYTTPSIHAKLKSVYLGHRQQQQQQQTVYKDLARKKKAKKKLVANVVGPRKATSDRAYGSLPD